MDAVAAVIGASSIFASAGVAIASMQTQRRLAADAARIDRENELRSVLDSAALALQAAHRKLLTAVESVDRPPSYEDDERAALHETTMAEDGRYWMAGAVSELEDALQDLDVLQARLAVRLGNKDRLYGIVHNAHNVLTNYGLRPVSELAAGAGWTDRPFGESLREMTRTALQTGRDAQGTFFDAASRRVGVEPSIVIHNRSDRNG